MVWVTPDDSTIIIVNSATGLVTGVKPNSQGRVQAILGSLTTGFFTLTILARPDTIILPADSVQTVAIDDNTSLPLLPVLGRIRPRIHAASTLPPPVPFEPFKFRSLNLIRHLSFVIRHSPVSLPSSLDVAGVPNAAGGHFAGERIE